MRTLCLTILLKLYCTHFQHEIFLFYDIIPVLRNNPIRCSLKVK